MNRRSVACNRHLVHDGVPNQYLGRLGGNEECNNSILIMTLAH